MNPEQSGVAAGLAPISAAGVMAQLAAAVHALWCEQMRADGWSGGREFNPAARTHDAMVPFERLDPDDQWTMVEILEADGAARDLIRLVRYPRGEQMPLRTRDMRTGLVIESTVAQHQDGTPWRGRVLGWTTDPQSHRLTSIRVRWDHDGSEDDHPALENEVRAAGG